MSGIIFANVAQSFDSMNDAMVYSSENPNCIVYAKIIPERINAVLFNGQIYGDVNRIPLPSTGTPDMSWYNTTDTEFELDNADKLAGLKVIVSGGGYGQSLEVTDSFVGKIVKIIRDIDLSNYSSGDGWEAIDSFYGTFDGGGYIIRNLTINTYQKTQVGLFGGIWASETYPCTIKNVGLENANVVGTVAGALCGTFSGSTGTIINCYSKGNVSAYNTNEFSAPNPIIGGLIGEVMNKPVINNCYTDGFVQGNPESIANRLGGVVGAVDAISTVSNCYSTVAIRTTDHPNSGQPAAGVVGYVPWDSSGSGQVNVSNCAALNPSIRGHTPNYRVSGLWGGVGVDNVGFIGMLNDRGNVWNSTDSVPGSDGTDITAQDIIMDGTIGGRFTSDNGWTTQNGKLPGLFGKAVDLPPYLMVFDRVPITTDLILKVPAGGLNSPFATPQGAYNWAVANLDFRNVDTLTINIEGGIYDALIMNKVMQGLNKIVVNGNGDVTINKIKINEANRVDLSNITVNCPDSDFALTIRNSKVYLAGNLTVTGNGSGCGIFIGHGGLLNGDSISSLSISGAFGDMINTEHAGLLQLSNSTVKFNGTVTGFVLNSVHHGDMIVSNCNIAGTVTGAKYRVIVCSALNTGGLLNSIPGTVAGVSDASSYAN